MTRVLSLGSPGWKGLSVALASGAGMDLGGGMRMGREKQGSESSPPHPAPLGGAIFLHFSADLCPPMCSDPSLYQGAPGPSSPWAVCCAPPRSPPSTKHHAAGTSLWSVSI